MNFSLVSAQSDSSFQDLSEVYIEAAAYGLTKEAGLKVQKIDSLALSQFHTADLARLLEAYTPIFIRFYSINGLATPAFRGASAAHTQVFWNGLRLNAPTLGQTDLSLFPVALGDAVEIDYGAASLRYGEGGFGGSIRLLSRNPKDSCFRLSTHLSHASFATLKGDAAMSYGKNKWRATTKIFYRKAQNDFPFRYNGQNYRQTRAAIEQYGFLQEIYAQINTQNQISLRTWYQQSQRQLPPPVTIRNNQETQDDSSIRFLLDWNFARNNFISTLSIGIISDYLLYENQISEIRSRSQVKSVQTHWDIEYGLPRWELKAGIRAEKDVADIDGYAQTQSQYRISSFASAEYEIHRRIKTHVLIRTLLIDNQWRPILPLWGIAWDFSTKPQMSLAANLSRNFRNPTLNDLYWFPVGNPNLKPEKGINGELTWEWINEKKTNWKWQTRITYFHALIDDWILWSPTVAGYWRPDNLRKVRLKGLETQFFLRYEFATGELSWHQTYSYTDSQNLRPLGSGDASVGKQLIYVPFHNYKNNLRVRYQKWSATIGLRYASERFVSTDNRRFLPSYTLLDASLAYAFDFQKKHCFQVLCQVNNWNNFQYQSVALYPMPGRQWELRLLYKL
ncbi:MAG: TonB-dependent receptor [Bernardetiaceae bacterium]|nr:TonB-dependent receptor [Bernardetiaceae bacterium]